MQDQHVDILQRKRNFLAAEAIIPLIHYSTVAYAHNKAIIDYRRQGTYSVDFQRISCNDCLGFCLGAAVRKKV